MSVFKLQSLITITLDTGVDCTASTLNRILYEQPDGTKGVWVATWVGAGDPTKIAYNLLAGGAIPQAGIWRMQAEITIGGRKGFGDIIEEDFKNNLL